jgi:hypothetical protein
MYASSHKSTALLAALFLGHIAFGQELHLKSRTIVTAGSGSGLHAHARTAEADPIHQIIQFDHMPGVDDLNALLAAGFRITGAVPDNAVMAIAPDPATAANVTALAAGIQWVGAMETSDKMSPIFETSSAAQGNMLDAIVEFHADIDTAAQQAIAAAESLTFLHPAALIPGHMLVNATYDKLLAIAAHDEVAYIFPADAALTTENEMIPCVGMLTAAGPVGQYANIVHGWDLNSDQMAHLNYVFGTLTSKVPAQTVQSEILRAMNAWSAVTNVVFEQGTSATATRTILVKFASGPHGDSYPFDGPGGVLGHTFYPVPINSESIAGDIHLDADENWHAGGDLDIYTVVLHELGHAIGLGHSDKPGDVMYPYYHRGAQLSANDIGAARELYGVPGNVAPSAETAPQTPVTVTTTIAPAPAPVPAPAPAPAPVPTPAKPLSLTLNAVPSPGAATQTSISGTVVGGVAPLTVQFQTDKGYTGKASVSASGTWSAAGVALVAGSNTITVTAFDSSHQTISQSEQVNRTASAPTAAAGPVRVQITSPSAAVSTAKGTTVSVGGAASGGVGITQVTWQTSTGQSGTADGTDHWLATNIPLMTGTNTVLIRAYDAAGASAWASVVVVRH